LKEKEERGQHIPQRKRSAHTTTADEQIYLEDVLNKALTSLCFSDEAPFSDKRENFCYWEYSS
jgi:hypothetical protein